MLYICIFLFPLYLLPKQERLWRKNMSPDYNNTGCRGVDLNRNFDFHWGEGRKTHKQHTCNGP